MIDPVLTEEELEFERNSQNVTRITSGPEFEATKKMFEQAAANSIAKRQAISVKIPKNEISTFKQKAAEEGLKYQTKLNQLIYQYNRGQLTSNP